MIFKQYEAVPKNIAQEVMRRPRVQQKPAAADAPRPVFHPL
jgi:hypothetical protein